MVIQRYHFYWRTGGASMEPTMEGEYVKYKDHKKIVDDLERQLRESQNARMAAIARQWGKEKY